MVRPMLMLILRYRHWCNQSILNMLWAKPGFRLAFLFGLPAGIAGFLAGSYEAAVWLKQHHAETDGARFLAEAQRALSLGFPVLAFLVIVMTAATLFSRAQVHEQGFFATQPLAPLDIFVMKVSDIWGGFLAGVFDFILMPCVPLAWFLLIDGFGIAAAAGATVVLLLTGLQLVFLAVLLLTVLVFLLPRRLPLTSVVVVIFMLIVGVGLSGRYGALSPVHFGARTQPPLRVMEHAPLWPQAESLVELVLSARGGLWLAAMKALLREMVVTVGLAVLAFYAFREVLVLRVSFVQERLHGLLYAARGARVGGQRVWEVLRFLLPPEAMAVLRKEVRALWEDKLMAYGLPGIVIYGGVVILSLLLTGAVVPARIGSLPASVATIGYSLISLVVVVALFLVVTVPFFGMIAVGREGAGIRELIALPLSPRHLLLGKVTAYALLASLGYAGHALYMLVWLRGFYAVFGYQPIVTYAALTPFLGFFTAALTVCTGAVFALYKARLPYQAVAPVGWLIGALLVFLLLGSAVLALTPALLGWKFLWAPLLLAVVWTGVTAVLWVEAERSLKYAAAALL